MTCANPVPNRIPLAVSIVLGAQDSPSRCLKPSNLQLVYSTRPDPKQNKLLNTAEGVDARLVDKFGRRRFGICVTPLNLRYDKVYELVQMLEFNRLLGASHVFFYNYTLGDRAASIMDYYYKLYSFVTVVQWPVPVTVHVWPIPPGHVEEIHYFAQVPMLNECLMRAMSRFEYIVYTDLDEFAVPRSAAQGQHTWNDLYEQYFSQHKSSLYYFRNTFYKLEWPDDPLTTSNETIKALQINLLLKTKREPTIMPSGSRSKMMVRAEDAETVGIHNIWDFRDGVGRTGETVSTDVGILHHYRNWETDPHDPNYVEDRYVPQQYGDEIFARITSAHRTLKERGIVF